VGLAQVLFQAGVFVPGTAARMSPVDNIFSHFPADESQTVELGRLGEETRRLSEIFRGATRLSLILLNESLTSTSYSEGLYLAQEIVRAMRYLGARAIFNTHLHELAESVDALNAGTDGDSMILSMITGIVEGRRSYRVEPGAPLGKSYAMDIALKFGVSFEQIARVIDEKNIREPSSETMV
jgi:DNA mismatch repair ATPase MutS